MKIVLLLTMALLGSSPVTISDSSTANLRDGEQSIACSRMACLPRPTPQQIAWRLRSESGRILHPNRAAKYRRQLRSHPGWTQFIAPMKPITISDGHGGGLTAVAAIINNGDGSAGNVFFWHNRNFLRAADSHHLTNLAVSVNSPRAGVLVVRYTHYRPNDPRCCPSLPPQPVVYRWNENHLEVRGNAP